MKVQSGVKAGNSEQCEKILWNYKEALRNKDKVSAMKFAQAFKSSGCQMSQSVA